MNGFPTVSLITVPYPQLQDKSSDLSGKVVEAFGPDGLGIISVSDVPGYSSLRKDLLQLLPRLHKLPEEVLEELEDRESKYNNGWGFGKEKLQSGEPDMLKCAFHANPAFDVPTNDPSDLKRYPWYCKPNRWPTKHLPELEAAFKALGNLMLEVGLLLADHCDQYILGDMKNGTENGTLEEVLKRSRCQKGRCLYYLPKKESGLSANSSGPGSWLRWHTDYCCLTGLAAAMYLKNGDVVACPDQGAGLYVKTRKEKIVRIMLKEDEIAYQVGETVELLSKGRLCATHHSVQAPEGEGSLDVGRSTFVLFIQPDWDEILRFPEEITLHQKLIKPNEVMTYGEYSDRRHSLFYT